MFEGICPLETSVSLPPEIPSFEIFNLQDVTDEENGNTGLVLCIITMSANSGEKNDTLPGLKRTCAVQVQVLLEVVEARQGDGIAVKVLQTTCQRDIGPGESRPNLRSASTWTTTSA